jgi:hypothetical protein
MSRIHLVKNYGNKSVICYYRMHHCMLVVM